MMFFDRVRLLREELGLPEKRSPLFYDNNREPVFADGFFEVEGVDGDELEEV